MSKVASRAELLPIHLGFSLANVGSRLGNSRGVLRSFVFAPRTGK
jgi:hypothetical protein